MKLFEPMNRGEPFHETSCGVIFDWGKNSVYYGIIRQWRTLGWNLKEIYSKFKVGIEQLRESS